MPVNNKRKRSQGPLGYISAYEICERTSNWAQIRPEKRNQVQNMWGWLAARLFGYGDRDYMINAMYLEFANVADSDDRVSPPEFDKDEQADYYLSLAGDRDFLRVAITAPPAIDIAPGYEAAFTDGLNGNRVSFRAESGGSSGVNGLPFSADNNSLIIGLALVAVPDWSDQTKDIIFGRSYYDAADQILKTVGKQIGFVWKQTFPEQLD